MRIDHYYFNASACCTAKTAKDVTAPAYPPALPQFFIFNSLYMISFTDYALAVYPFLELEWFHRAYYRVLEAFAEGRIRRLMITMPPQHGKSVGATTLLPAYLLGLDPDLRIAVASYSAALASKFSRLMRQGTKRSSSP